MNALSPLLLKILLISLALSLIGFSGGRLLRHSPLPRQRNFINLIMATLLLLPLLVWIGPSLVRVPLPPAEADSPALVSFSYNLVAGEEPRGASLSPESLLVWTWLLGSLVGLLQLGWGIGRIQYTIRSARPLSERERSACHALGRDLPLRRIRLSSRLEGPAAAGFVRPWVLIPQSLFSCLEPSELRAVVLHEWAHIRNRDGLSSLLGESVMLLYWWNPLLRMMQRKRERLQEMIGDETAVRSAGELAYAKALLSLAEKSRYNPQLRGAMALFGPLSLKERIERILNKERRMNRKTMRMGVIGIGSLAMALMLVASGTRFFVAAPGAEDAAGNPALARDAQAHAQDEEKPKRLSAGSPQPALIKLVKPEYPTQAVQNRVSSHIVLVITISPEGKVEQAKVVSGHPLFNEAAIGAVKQWLFAPYLENGRARRVQVTQLIQFGFTADNRPEVRVVGRTPSRAGSTPQEGSLQVTSSASIPAKHPKRIKEVAPVYPPEALAAKAQGTVILEVTTNPQGQVRALRVISGHPLFNGAAIDAVKQWTFEPTLEKGQPKSAVFPVTVPFTLPQVPPQPSEATGKQP